LSDLLSARNNRWTFNEIWGVLPKCVRIFHIWLKSDSDAGHYGKMYCTCVSAFISRRTCRLSEQAFRVEVAEENKTQYASKTSCR
jgi:hypothetical protein